MFYTCTILYEHEQVAINKVKLRTMMFIFKSFGYNIDRGFSRLIANTLWFCEAFCMTFARAKRKLVAMESSLIFTPATNSVMTGSTLGCSSSVLQEPHQPWIGQCCLMDHLYSWQTFAVIVEERLDKQRNTFQHQSQSTQDSCLDT